MRKLKISSLNGQDNKLSYLSIVLFPALPFVSVLLCAMSLLSKNKRSDRIYYAFFFLLASYLGLINGTKVPENDLTHYFDFFEEAGSHHFFEYIFIPGKEPAFTIYNYLVYHVVNGSTQLYIVLTTVIAYYFLFIALFKFFKAVCDSSHVIVFAIMLAAFFPQQFSLSALILRQFMAASILMYAIVLKLFYPHKKAYPYCLAAIFMHSTSLFFVPLLYIGLLKKRLQIKTILPLSILLALSVWLLPHIATYMSSAFGKNVLTYAIIRAAEGTTYELGSLTLLPVFTMGTLMVILLWTTNNKNTWILVEGKLQGFAHFSNIYLIFSIFVLANLRMTELAGRFFFYTYFFFPFVFPLVFLKSSKEMTLIRPLISTGFVAYFIYRLENGVWEYAPLEDLLLNNVFAFFV